MRRNIVKPKKVMECVGPKLGRQRRASKHGANAIGNGAMSRSPGPF
jgi:hypothetical protein